MQTKNLPIILASTSIFRQQLLKKLPIHFTVTQPICDETPLPNELASETAVRLAQTKAKSLQQQFPQAIIIGSDQVAFCQQQQLGKPLNMKKANSMLQILSGQYITFYTALAVYNTASHRMQTHCDMTTVKMRSLSAQLIQQYLEAEPDAIYCTGAAKSEGLGMLLIEKIKSHDPNALIGLPMLKLIEFLLTENVNFWAD